MNTLVRQLGKRGAARLPVSIPQLIRLSGQHLLMPVYHLCSPRPVPHIRHLYPVHSNAQFRTDMETLLRYYEPIGLETVLALLRGETQLTQPAFWLSFDDGLREVKEEALPILRELGIPATLFLNNDFLDNQDLFFRFKASLLIEQLQQKSVSGPLKSEVGQLFQQYGRTYRPAQIRSSFLAVEYAQQTLLDEVASLLELDFDAYLREQQPYLRRTEVREVLAEGHSVGGHSLDHPLYHRLPFAEQLRQTRQSVSELVRTFKLPYRTFAFPFTDFGITANWFQELHGTDLDASFGSAGLKQEHFPLHGQRFPMEGRWGQPLGSTTQRLRAEYVYYLLKQPLGKNVIVRR